MVNCNNILENMNMRGLLNQHRRRNREKSEKSELYKMLPNLAQGTPLNKLNDTSVDGNVVFNYNTLQVSKDVAIKTQRLVESMNVLNRTFLNLFRTGLTSKGSADARRMYLNSFLSVIEGLKKSIAALEESLKEEFSDLGVSVWEKSNDGLNTQGEAEAERGLHISDVMDLHGLGRLAGEHLPGEASGSQRLADGTPDLPDKDSSAHVAAHTAEDDRPNPHESGVGVTKKLVVKLTPVAVGQESTSAFPKQEGSRSTDSADEKASLKDEAAGDDVSSHSASVTEHSNRRSPRLKTTPLRRPSDAKAKAARPAVDSDSEHEGDSAVAAAVTTNTEGQDLTADEDDSDSDSVPAVLLEGAAMSHSSDDEGSQASTQVAKQRLFWLAKSPPLSADKMRHKRKMLGHSSDSGNRKGSSSESTSDGRDSPEEGQRLNTLRPSGKRHLVQKENDDAARKKRRLQPGSKRSDARQDAKSASRHEATDSSSSSSSSSDNDDEDDDADDDQDDHNSGSESDQKMKPITEEVTLLGAAAFHQSSGEACSVPSHIPAEAESLFAVH